MTIRTHLAALVIGATLSYAACNKQSAPAAPAAATAITGAPHRYTVGDKTRCPVNGEEFVVAADTVQVEHEGKHYAFCCADCKPSFDKDPAKYTKKN
jgi:YHS domain-containing protein